MFLNTAKYFKTVRCGCGAVAFIFSIYLRPGLYPVWRVLNHFNLRSLDCVSRNRRGWKVGLQFVTGNDWQAISLTTVVCYIFTNVSPCLTHILRNEYRLLHVSSATIYFQGASMSFKVSVNSVRVSNSFGLDETPSYSVSPLDPSILYNMALRSTFSRLQRMGKYACNMSWAEQNRMHDVKYLTEKIKLYMHMYLLQTILLILNERYFNKKE